VNRALALLAPLIPVLALALSSPARAGATVRLAYEAPEGCPAQPDFVAAVAARGGEFDGTPSAASHSMMVVAIRKDGTGFAGAFQLRDDQTASDKREVYGQSCAEVVDALAVVTAIALRSNVADLAAPGADVTPPPAPPGPPQSRAEAPAKPPVPRRLRARTAYFPSRTQEVEVGAGTLRFDRQQSYVVAAGAAVGMVPSVVLPRYDLALVTANFVTAPDGTQRIDGAIVKARLTLFDQGTYRSADTATTIYGASFAFGICSSPLYDTRGLVLLFCGEYGGGFLNLLTKGTDGAQIQSKNAGFGTIALDAEIQYNLGSTFVIEANVGGVGLIGNFTAERADGSSIFGTSSGTWHTSAYGLLGIGFHL
jgi:hypothetical protein